MPAGGKILDIWKNVARKEIETLKGFLTTPKGLFETVDEAIKILRSGIRDTVSAVGLRLPARVAEKLRTVM